MWRWGLLLVFLLGGCVETRIAFEQRSGSDFSVQVPWGCTMPAWKGYRLTDNSILIITTFICPQEGT